MRDITLRPHSVALTSSLKEEYIGHGQDPGREQSVKQFHGGPSFPACLVAPQRLACPGRGIAIEPQPVPPAIVPLDAAFLACLFLLRSPRKTRIQLRRCQGAETLCHVLKREKERRAIALSRSGGQRHHQDGDGKDRKQ